MPEPFQQQVSNHGYEKFFKKKLDAAERAGDKGAVKKIGALCPDLVSNSRGDGGVDLWISLAKQMQQLQQQQVQLVEAAVRHKHEAAEQEERAIEIGKSISQLRMRLTNTAKESEAKVLDEKSLDFADEETKKAYQDALKLERAAEIAEAALTLQIERKRAAEMEACVSMGGRREDARPKRSKMLRSSSCLLAKVSKEDRPGTETTKEKEPKPKILFQNVTSFGHQARTWLLSDQKDYDIMEVAEHHLDVSNAAEKAGRLRAEVYCSIWTPANPTGREGTSGGNHGNDQTTLEILEVPGRLWRLCGTFETLGLDTYFLAFEGSHFGSGICILFHRRRCAANQVKMAQLLEFSHSIRTPFVIAADFNMEPDQLWETGWGQSLGPKANIVVPGGTHLHNRSWANH